MYAVIKTGGKQYKVAVGEKLKVEQIPAELDIQYYHNFHIVTLFDLNDHRQE